MAWPKRKSPEQLWFQRLHKDGCGKTTMTVELLTEAAKENGCRIPNDWAVNRSFAKLSDDGLVAEKQAYSNFKKWVITDAGRAALVR